MFCHSCGKEIPEDAYFCPRCGVKTRKGLEAGVSTPWESMRDAFSRVEDELERAFEVASKEMGNAFKKVRDEMTKATSREPIVCKNCREKNLASSRFCYKCGKELK